MKTRHCEAVLTAEAIQSQGIISGITGLLRGPGLRPGYAPRNDEKAKERR